MATERQDSTGTAADWGAKDAAASIDAAVPLLASGMTSDQVGATMKPPVTGQAVRNWLSTYPQMRQAVRDLRAELYAAMAGAALADGVDNVRDLVAIRSDSRIEPQHRIRAAAVLKDIAHKGYEAVNVQAALDEIRTELAELAAEDENGGW